MKRSRASAMSFGSGGIDLALVVPVAEPADGLVAVARTADARASGGGSRRKRSNSCCARRPASAADAGGRGRRGRDVPGIADDLRAAAGDEARDRAQQRAGARCGVHSCCRYTRQYDISSRDRAVHSAPRRARLFSGMPSIVFEGLHPDVRAPQRGTAGSAGYDLAAYLAVAHRARLARRGDGASGPASSAAARSRSRSRRGKRRSCRSGSRRGSPRATRRRSVRDRAPASRPISSSRTRRAPSTPDYPDEWCVPVKNGGAAPLVIAHGDRIAQMVLARFEVLEFVDGSVDGRPTVPVDSAPRVPPAVRRRSVGPCREGLNPREPFASRSRGVDFSMLAARVEGTPCVSR